MYNSINPINITYRNPRQNYGANAGAPDGQKPPVHSNEQKQSGSNQRFPNGAKVAIDYTKNTINISQIVTDFKSTVLAINAPSDVSDEVNSYLSLVEKESKKPNPSKEIIVSNLKNASKVSDAYIARSLNKPSKVVEGWIDALFMQNIELKADPTHINPDFQLDIPKKENKTQTQTLVNQEPQNISQEQTQNYVAPAANHYAQYANNYDIANTAPLAPEAERTSAEFVGRFPQQAQKYINPQPQPEEQIQVESFEQEIQPQVVQIQPQEQIENVPQQLESEPAALVSPNFFETPVSFAGFENIDEIETAFEPEPEPAVLPKKPVSKYITTEHDRILSYAIKDAKTLLNENDDPAGALETLNNALGELREDTNPNLRAAIHYERGKIFDDYDYINYALRDYYEATKCEDDNLKSRAHLEMARIYNDYVEFEPAVEHYQDAVGYSGEANNLRTQARILDEMATMYADRFDGESVEMLTDLALESAENSGDKKLVSKIYTNAARNFEYMGDDKKALNGYKNAAITLAKIDNEPDTLEALATNYEEAANVMERLGNVVKAENLLSTARQYRKKAELWQNLEAA